MTDDQRDDLLRSLETAVTKLATSQPLINERMLEKIEATENAQRASLETQGLHGRRLSELETWRENLRGQASGRGWALGWGKWALATLIAIVGLCSGLVTWAISNLAG